MPCQDSRERPCAVRQPLTGGKSLRSSSSDKGVRDDSLIRGVRKGDPGKHVFPAVSSPALILPSVAGKLAKVIELIMPQADCILRSPSKAVLRVLFVQVCSGMLLVIAIIAGGMAPVLLCCPRHLARNSIC